MPLQELLLALGDEIEDAEEETFLLFSQSIPSQNLGFIDAKATELEITIAGNDLTISQSPGLLSSNREAGTTGAVVWKITPLIAEWFTMNENVLFKTSVLSKTSQVLELGCGISGILALSLAPYVRKYIATDQDYVFKLLKHNLKTNTKKRKDSKNARRHAKSTDPLMPANDVIDVLALDWESSSVTNLLTLLGGEPVDAIIACDCIYNETLIEPFLRTCAETCQQSSVEAPTLCVIAQQLRSDAIFDEWLAAFLKVFRVWRIPDDLLIEGLRQGSGFVVHFAILR